MSILEHAFLGCVSMISYSLYKKLFIDIFFKEELMFTLLYEFFEVFCYGLEISVYFSQIICSGKIRGGLLSCVA